MNTSYGKDMACCPKRLCLWDYISTYDYHRVIVLPPNVQPMICGQFRTDKRSQRLRQNTYKQALLSNKKFLTEEILTFKNKQIACYCLLSEYCLMDAVIDVFINTVIFPKNFTTYYEYYMKNRPILPSKPSPIKRKLPENIEKSTEQAKLDDLRINIGYKGLHTDPISKSMTQEDMDRVLKEQCNVMYHKWRGLKNRFLGESIPKLDESNNTNDLQQPLYSKHTLKTFIGSEVIEVPNVTGSCLLDMIISQNALSNYRLLTPGEFLKLKWLTFKIRRLKANIWHHDVMFF